MTDFVKEIATETTNDAAVPVTENVNDIKKDNAMPTDLPSKIAKGEELKGEGNIEFKNGEYKKAIRKYRLVFAYVNGLVKGEDQYAKYASDATLLSGEQAEQVDVLKIACFSNLAMCYIKIGNFDKAEKACNDALAIDPEAVKPTFRLGQVYLNQKRFDASKTMIVKAINLDPKNKSFRAEFEKWKKASASWKKDNQSKQKAMFGNIFK